MVRVAHGPRGEIVRLEHDACGRVIRRRVERKGFRPQTWEFEWNAQDQMIAAHCPDGRVWEYAYDPFGRRIAKECRDERHDFLWDGDVVARETRDGKTIDWFFEPGSFRPMARAEGTRLAHIVTDHLGTPKEMVSERGALIWAADHDTWGTVRRHWRPDVGASASGSAAPDLWAVEEPEQDYAPEEYTLLCPIRFQGQWEDAETGLNYSRFRYYDPSSGHFNAKDPIGFQGGTLQSAYVLTPTVQIDPNGLRSYVVYRGIKGGQPYIGCASSADPNATFNDIMRERYSDASAEGFDSDTFERLYLGDNRNAARGLEQRYFEQAGGLDATANAQNPVGPNNEMRDVYLGAADAVLSGIDIPCCYGRDRGRGSDVPC
ncbi:MAG: RHS repeat-associated core domain-containing protein [Pseudomonadota bacterium]